MTLIRGDSVIEYGVAPVTMVGRMKSDEVIRMGGLDEAKRWVKEWEDDGNGKDVWRIVSRHVVKTEWV